MPASQTNRIVRHLRQTLMWNGGGLSDRQLLESFLTQHDEDAFQAVVKRHGPMILAVCRRILRNMHDAEDAFQESHW